MKFERPNSNIVPFGTNANENKRFAFGTNNYTNDINENLNDSFKLGWETVGINSKPPRQWFNGLAYASTYLTSYLYQAGIPEWNDKQKYYINSIVMGSDGNIYRSLAGTKETPNVNNNPTLAGSVSWKSILSEAVKLTGNETIAGVKTFSSNIVGNITGNSGTASRLSTDRNNYKTVTDSVVVGELMWKIYGNSHTIFDASNSTTPRGTTKNNTNPDVAWAPTYPTLMGYNGVETYGVRVDSSRYADQLKTARTINGVAFDGSANITVSDSTAVKLTGNETIAGVKTFSLFPVTPSSAPTTNYEVANKKYVDDKTANGGFTQSLTTNGWTKLPNGLILQWGKFNSTTSDFQNINFNIVFPTQVYYVGSGATFQHYDMDNPALWTATIITNSYFSANRSDHIKTDKEFSWIAIGY